MFTGIIECIGSVEQITKDRENLDITIKSSITSDLKIDQSVAHNGVCLTVVGIENDHYNVTAIGETIAKTNLSQLKVGEVVNLERAMKLGDRLDGHIVQGHVDQIATCIAAEEFEGSWHFSFKYDSSLGNITIEKGSITINGVSLTVVNSMTDEFSVAIIPYTYDNTNFKILEVGTIVNLEFDLIGKYISKLCYNSLKAQ